eukprot:scaffold22695_cov90-Cylindrotheca_fusiformis.AAC.1
MIQSTRPLSVIKNACFHVLKQHNLYLHHAHPFSPEKLDVGSVGFILGAAHYHSPGEKQRFRMKMAIERWWRELDDSGKALWKNRFKLTKDGPDVIPDFFITAKSVQARDSLSRELASASALLVMTPLEHIRAMSTLLEEVFAAPDDEDEDNPGIRRDIAAERPIRFVPSRFQRGPESDIYVKLVKQQELYIHNYYGHVSLAGICSDHMEGRPIQYVNEDGTPLATEVLHRQLMKHQHIHRVDPAGSLATLGKWNVETTKEHLDDVKAHLDRDGNRKVVVLLLNRLIHSARMPRRLDLLGRFRSHPPTKGRPIPQPDNDAIGKKEVKRILKSELDSIYMTLKSEFTELKKSILQDSQPKVVLTRTPPEQMSPSVMDQEISSPTDMETMSTNHLLRQLMMGTRASNQKLQEGQNGLYHNLTALDNKHKATTQEVFAPDDEDEDNPGIRRDIAAERPIRFVPSCFQRGPESDVYVTKLVKQQELYIHNYYGHVSLASICSDHMEGRPIQFVNEDGTPLATEVLHRQLGSLATLGKWNVETTKEHLDEVKAHLDR